MNPATPPNNHPPAEDKAAFIRRKWKTFVRLFKYFVFSCIILTVMEIGVAYWLVSSRWHLLVSEEKMRFFADEVSKAEPLPANFMRVYTANYPRHVNTTLTQQIFINYSTRFLLRQTNLDKKPHCFCDMVYDVQKKRYNELEDIEWDGRLQDLEFGFGIEKYSSPDKCFNYVVSFWVHDTIRRLNPKQFPHLANKSIESMSDDELIEVILLMKGKHKFNRHRNPQKFEKAFAAFKANVDSAKYQVNK